MDNSSNTITIPELYDELYTQYGDMNWWPCDTPYEMMAGAILTQNTNWGNVKKAIANFSGRLTPQLVMSLPADDLAKIIRPAGYYNVKAARLKSLTEWYLGHGGDIDSFARLSTEELRQELLSVSGVGRETADSILVYALGRTSFVVDAYTRRLLTRLGFDPPDGYDDIRLMIESHIKRDLYTYNNFHAVIVEHCKQFCRVKPVCEGCALVGYCRLSKSVTEQANRNTGAK